MEPNEMERYTFLSGFLSCLPILVEHPTGEWVRYSDAMQIITALQAQIDGMIKRPTVEVVETESFDPRDRYQTELNGHCVGIHGTKDNAELQASCYRMYLGMEGSEG